MPSDYYKRFLHLGVQATCPECGITRPLREFRKWWGSKRLLRTLCRVCEPEKSLEELTPEQRQQALDNQRAYATPTRVANLNANEADATRRRRSTSAKRRHSVARTQAWAPLLHIFRTELDWCRKGRLGKYATQPHQDFFDAYEAALTDALARAKAKRGNSTSTSQVPPPEAFMFPETRASLARLYAATSAAGKRRLSRDPAFIEWERNLPDNREGEK